MKICKTHAGKEFKLRDGQYGPFYSHVISGDKDSGFTYHSAKLDEIDKEILPEENGSAPSSNTTSENFKKDSFYTCNAMNNAVALVVAGKVEESQLEAAYRRILKILET